MYGSNCTNFITYEVIFSKSFEDQILINRGLNWKNINFKDQNNFYKKYKDWNEIFYELFRSGHWMSLESNSLIGMNYFVGFVLNSSMMDDGGGFIARVISCCTWHGYEEDEWPRQAI